VLSLRDAAYSPWADILPAAREKRSIIRT
jgi:hypothetical protein